MHRPAQQRASTCKIRASHVFVFGFNAMKKANKNYPAIYKI